MSHGEIGPILDIEDETNSEMESTLSHLMVNGLACREDRIRGRPAKRNGRRRLERSHGSFFNHAPPFSQWFQIRPGRTGRELNQPKETSLDWSNERARAREDAGERLVL